MGETKRFSIIAKDRKGVRLDAGFSVRWELTDDQGEIDDPSGSYISYTAPGELWRSRYDDERYLIIINNGHADFIYASKQKSRKLKYISKLFAKELVLANFPEVNREQILERMIELQLYTEENL